MQHARMGAPMTSREQILHALYEAAEIEHNLMCTYLYAAFSLKTAADLPDPAQGAAVTRWRRAILDVAIDEMGHLAAVWNITSALGGAPRFGRDNFPIDLGDLPAGIVVKLAPFNLAVLQHFIHLERPHGSDAPDGEGFAPERLYQRGAPAPRLTPMGIDYDTVGAFYECLGQSLRLLVEGLGEDAAFCGDPRLQLTSAEIDLSGALPVRCLSTALSAFNAIVTQGEGSREHTENSHFAIFIAIRDEFEALRRADPHFTPAFPAAHNPVLRRPPVAEGRVWIENEDAAGLVDLGNAAYGLMLRLLAFSYVLRSPDPAKKATVELAIGLMRAVAQIASRAARLPAGPSNPGCNAGLSFIALRDAASLPDGPGARRLFIERFEELSAAAAKRDPDDAGLLASLAAKAAKALA
jgi:hypothetical protein